MITLLAMKARPIILTDKDRKTLHKVTQAATSEQRMALRSWIVLLAAEERTNTEIGQALDIDRKTAGTWRSRYAARGIEGLQDLPRSGRPSSVDGAARCQILVLACSLCDKVSDPEHARDAFNELLKHVKLSEEDQERVDGAIDTIAEAMARAETRDRAVQPQWTVASLRQAAIEAEIAQVSASTIWRILNDLDIQPHRHAMWLHSPDPQFKEKVTEICELYLNPPEGARVICVDEKSGMQILERKYADQSAGCGKLSRREFEYVRHGTMCLFAGFEVHTGQVFARMREGRTAWDLRCFMDELASYYSEGETHIIWDNLNTHCNQEWKEAFNEQHQGRFHFHYTPIHASWVNQVECFFSILARRVLRRGSFTSACDLAWKVLSFISGWNETEAHPFRWTFTGYPLQTALRRAA